MATENLSAINKQSYLNDAVVNYWTHYKNDLFYGEGVILSSQRSWLASARCLDLGVGGGRTTGHLIPLVKSYVGLDYSDKLIEQCRAKFPGVEFICADACELASIFEQHRFEFVLFSFNGLDCLSEQQRQRFLKQAHRVLSSGGRLLFSSHNLHAAEIRGRAGRFANIASKTWRCLLERKPLNACRELIAAVNYAKNCGKEYRGDEIIYLVDPAQRNREIYAWIKPERQVRELQAAGFQVLSVHDWAGQAYDLDQLSRIGSHSAYYLAERP